MSTVGAIRAEVEALVEDRPPSIGQMFLDRVRQSGTLEAYRYPTDSGWESLTWQQTKDRVWTLAAGLLAIGVEPENRVAIASNTRIEWILTDLAINTIGGATTTVYPTTTREDVIYILGDSDSRVLIAEDADQAAKVLGDRDKLPSLTKIVLIDGDGDGDDVMSLADLEKAGSALLAESPTAVDDALAKVGPETLATLLYTSGTTGKPKGALLVNDNWVYEGVSIDVMDILHPDDVQYLWLPLSHSFGKALEAIQLRIGFATAVDGNLDRIVDNLATVKPTFMAGAPRIFEKVRAKVITGVQEEGGLKEKIFGWAFGVGSKVSELRQQGQEPTGLLKFQYGLADKLVFSKIKERMGGRVRFFVSGSAALSVDVARWFDAAGLKVLEGYGLTETSAATFVNPPFDTRLGTVGPPVPGTKVRIDSDGEVLVKGPGVMRGYHNMPEATAEMLQDGWLRTGDIGHVDGDDFLSITDRKKDFIKTSGGKYVAPQKIEGIFKALSPQSSQIVVHGDTRNYCVALISLDEEAIQEWAQNRRLTGRSYQDLVASPEVYELVKGQVDELNKRLERWETIKDFKILTSDLSIENGGLTPSMKVRRKAVEKQYADVIDEMYAG